ncbi:unnamed protein product [Ilex paraguariensis]|uniref:F-box domain-containing protein n=1 Tax=Ilex paraguariensis TaxID=185542 RepID=A0ABC8SVX6_9AQUA
MEEKGQCPPPTCEAHTVTSINRAQEVSSNLAVEIPLEDRKWKDLDCNILKIIFDQLHVYDLFASVSSVCLSWKSTCWDLLFWSNSMLELSSAAVYLHNFNFMDIKSMEATVLLLTESFGNYSQLVEDDLKDVQLMKFLKSLMEGKDAYGNSLENWRQSIQTILIPSDLEITDQHLLYISERPPGLKSLFLEGASKITAKGFAEAIRSWKYLDVIHLGEFDDQHYTQIIEEIGINCKGLEELHISKVTLSEDIAHVLAKSLQNVKKLRFEAAWLFLSALKTVQERCLQLEEMHISKCTYPCRLRPDFTIWLGPISFSLIRNVGIGDQRCWTMEKFTDF